MRNFRRAKKTVDVSDGESVRIIRELQGHSRNELARMTGIPQATISAIENDRERLGTERAKVIAKALQCHSAVLVFPGWEIREGSAVAPLARHPVDGSSACDSNVITYNL